MNELQTSDFDYSLLDENTAEKLKKYDKQLNQIYQNYTIEVGEVLYNAQKEFANPRDGNFIKWIEHKGFKRQNAYNYINIYETFQSLESNEQKDVFLKQSKSIQIEMSKPSTKEEVNQAVFDGDIKTHKEYKEMEKKLKQAEQQAQAERRERERLEEENEKLANQEPERIEVIPDDYDFYKGNYESAVSLQKRYKEQLEEMRDELNKAHNELQNRSKSNTSDSELEQLKQKEESIKRRLDSYEKIHKIQTLFENVVLEVERLRNKLHVDVGINSWKVEEYENCLNNVIHLCEDLKDDLPNKNIIEGEIVND